MLGVVHGVRSPCGVCRLCFASVCALCADTSAAPRRTGSVDDADSDQDEGAGGPPAPFVTAALRFPDSVPSVGNIDSELAALGVALPSDPTGGGWGFHPLVPCPSDPVSNLFRVRLVCMLLETSGMFFCKGALKVKLDNFLTYFQVGRGSRVHRVHYPAANYGVSSKLRGARPCACVR